MAFVITNHAIARFAPRAFPLASRRAPAALGAVVSRTVGFSSGASETADVAALQAKLAEVREQIQELEEKKKQCKNDLRNAQKRHVTDLENETKYGITKFAKEILMVADNLERATSSVKQEELDKDKQLRKMHADVKRMRTVVADALEGFGVKEMEAMGSTFDPAKHEAMFAVPMPGKDPNTVFHVMEPGYMIHDRTLRAAKVGVVRE
eukprot:TRINITY_DN1842_c0_g1_i1.p2 TRINITY_DN1842_c0_g1~~TRINITY_DN1842_c0_g1_i1.p2  ORF type:complete len:229 (+),score=50.08 TRINITY_DN1842_c0_g1_i1:66-689(+)